MTEIHRMLALCTAHVTTGTAQLLDGDQLDYPVYVKGEYGWILPVLAGTHRGDLPGDLGACLDYAEALDCAWVMFDRDVNRIDGLPEYRW